MNSAVNDTSCDLLITFVAVTSLTISPPVTEHAFFYRAMLCMRGTSHGRSVITCRSHLRGFTGVSILLHVLLCTSAVSYIPVFHYSEHGCKNVLRFFILVTFLTFLTVFQN